MTFAGSSYDLGVNIGPSLAQAQSVDMRHSTLNEVYGHGQQIHISGDHAIINPSHQGGERQDFANWLSPLNFRQTQSDIYATRQEGTCEWVLDEKKFQEWQKGNSKTLWCPGIPGAGKTILASYIVDFLKRYKNPDVAVVYVYCNYKDRDKQTVHNLIANLLKQLTQDSLSTFERVKPQYKAHREHQFRPALHEVQSTLIAEMKKFSQVFIVIDALDEIPDDDNIRFELLHRLQSLGGNLLITSRNIASIKAALPDAQQLDVRARENDMRKYLESCILPGTRLDRLLAKDPTLREEVITLIIKSAQGMFLLCRLHINSLAAKVTRRELRVAVNNLPKGVNSAYDETMKRIEGLEHRLRELAKSVIMWITNAYRPLYVKELQQAIVLSSGLHDINDDDLVDETIIMDVCAGLVVVDATEFSRYSVFRLVHYTAQEYFDKYTQWPFPNPNPDVEITRVCLDALLLFPSHASFSKQYFNQGFYDYAAENWGHHARGPVEETNKAALEKFLRSELRADLAMGDPSDLDSYTEHSALHLCAFFGLARTMDYLLSGDAPIAQQDQYATTPLHIAARQGHVAVVSVLLDRNIDVNSKNHSGQTPLSSAATWGRVDVVQMLLKRHDVAINSKDNEGLSALSLAAEAGNKEIVLMLLGRHDIDINLRAAQGRTPLSFATGEGNTEVVKVLLARHDIEADLKCEDGQSPLSFAAGGGRVEVVQILLARHDVDINSKDKDDWTPLLFAIEKGGMEIIRVLLGRHDVDVKLRGTGQSLLSFAIKRGRVEVVKMLLARHDIDADSKDKDGQSPLSFAIQQGNMEVIRMILARHDVDAGSKTADGRTPLSFAAECGHTEVAKMLLARSDVEADPRDKDGQSPLSFAAKRGHMSAVRVLLAMDGVDDDSMTNDGRSPLSFAAAQGNVKIVRMLLRRQVDADSKTVCGRTPLSFAAEEGNIEVVKILLGRHNVAADSKDKDGLSPLSFAVKRGQVEVVKMLLAKHDVDVDSRTNDGRSPLSFAAAQGSVTVAKLLLARHGVNADSKTVHGRTPLSFAAEEGSVKVAKLLLRNHDVDAHSEDECGRTPFSFAIHRLSMEYSSAEYYNPILDLIGLLLDRDEVAGNSGCIAMVEQLFQRGDIDINSMGEYRREELQNKYMDRFRRDDMTPLMIAAAANCRRMSHILLSHPKTQINLKNSYGHTALMYAAATGAIESMKELLSCQDIEINATDNGGRTALALAAGYKKIDALQLLLARGDVEVDVVDSGGRTLLMYAAAIGQADFPQDLERYGYGPITVNITLSDRARIYEAREILYLLLHRDKIVIHPWDNDTCMPLAFSFKHGCDISLARLLLTRTSVGVDVNWKNESDYTPIWLAAWHGDEEVVEFLLTFAQVDVNLIPKNASRPPLWAAASCILDEINDISPYKLSIETLSKIEWDGCFGLDLLNGWHDDSSTIHVMSRSDTNEDAKKLGAKEVIRLLLATPRLDVNWRGIHERTLLLIAAKNGNQFLVEALLGRNDTDVNLQDKNGDSSLHCAVRSGHEHVVSLLLTRDDIAVNLRNATGQVPLHCIVSNDNSEEGLSDRVPPDAQEVIIKLLLERSDIEVDLEDNSGSSTLMLAYSMGNITVAKLLEGRLESTIMWSEGRPRKRMRFLADTQDCASDTRG